MGESAYNLALMEHGFLRLASGPWRSTANPISSTSTDRPPLRELAEDEFPTLDEDDDEPDDSLLKN
jgi:hypothetical protein